MSCFHSSMQDRQRQLERNIPTSDGVCSPKRNAENHHLWEVNNYRYNWIDSVKGSEITDLFAKFKPVNYHKIIQGL